MVCKNCTGAWKKLHYLRACFAQPQPSPFCHRLPAQKRVQPICTVGGENYEREMGDWLALHHIDKVV